MTLIHEVLGMHIHMISEFQYTLEVATIALNHKRYDSEGHT